MQKKNKYIEIKDKINEACKNNELNDTDRELARDVYTLMAIDKLAKLSEWSLSNGYLHNLEETIDGAINGYEIHLDNLISGDHKVILMSDYIETKNKIEELKKLKQEINDYNKALLEPFYDKVEDLFNECSENIGISQQVLNRLLNLHEKMENDDLYEAFESSKVIVDLKRCLNFVREKRKSSRIIELCDGILARRNSLRENVDKIAKHNKLNEDLLSSIGVKSIDELKTMKEEIIESNKKLMNSGLGEVLFGLNTNLKLALNKSNTPLRLYLQDVKNEEDLIDYISVVKELRDNLNKYMSRSFIFEEKYLLNTANSTSIEIATQDPEAAKDLINISEDDNPTLRSLLIEALLVIQTSSLDDMIIDKDELKKINKHFDKKTNPMIEEFFERYNDIVVDDMISVEKKPQKTK